MSDHTPPPQEKSFRDSTTSQGSNMTSGIRIVPYSPPRPVSVTSESVHFSSPSAATAATPTPSPFSFSSGAGYRQHSSGGFVDGDDGDDEDDDDLEYDENNYDLYDLNLITPTKKATTTQQAHDDQDSDRESDGSKKTATIAASTILNDDNGDDDDDDDDDNDGYYYHSYDDAAQDGIGSSPASSAPGRAARGGKSLVGDGGRGVSEAEGGSELGASAGPSHSTTPAPVSAPASTSMGSNTSRTASSHPHISHVHAPTDPDGQPTWRSAPSSASATSNSNSTSTSMGPSRRRNLVTTINSGKGTFTLQPLKNVRRSSSSAIKSPTPSLSSQSSLERLSDLFSTEGRPSTPLTTLPEDDAAQSSSNPCTPTSSKTQKAADHTGNSTSSPWNYNIVGGLRKVPVTPDNVNLKHQEQEEQQEKPLLLPAPDFQPSSPPTATQVNNVTVVTHHQPPQPPQLARAEEQAEDEQDPHALRNKFSFQSSSADSESASTASVTTNYKVYNSTPSAAPSSAAATPAGRRRTSASDYRSWRSRSSSESTPNYQILGRSSPAAPSSIVQSSPKSSGSEANYVVYEGASSPAVSPRSKPGGGRLHQEFSQESLVVPPLRPLKRKDSFEKLSPQKSRSTRSNRSSESYRRESFTSISSALGQDAIQTFLATPISLNRPGAPAYRVQDPWASSSSSSSAQPSAPPSSFSRVPMQAHPHQWSSQLSTVMSESEGGSESAASRPLSLASNAGRRSSGFPSNHSRHMLSISSSIALYDETSNSRSMSGSDSLDRPQPVQSRGGTVRLVRDVDEHGDGIADLSHAHELNQRPSRRRLSSFLSTSSSERNLHSSGSSRANSLTASSLPSWARLYYGSGERKWLRQPASSESMATDYYNDSRRSSSLRQGSPSTDYLPLDIHNAKRRGHDIRQPQTVHRASGSGSMGIGPSSRDGPPMRSMLRKQTSSIWSPHLRRDQRASGYSIWEPPSVSWSAESGLLGRRNIQVVLFITGFLLPLTWMIAAFLPLPSAKQPEMTEQLSPPGASDLESQLQSPRGAPVNDISYQSARWWRNLNRVMAVIGFLVIAAVIALSVVGTQLGWTS